VLEIELARKEKRWKKEIDVRQQDQTTKREVETKEDAPVDKPITVDPKLSSPGVHDVQAAPHAPFANPEPTFAEPRTRTPPPAYTAKSEVPPSRDMESVKTTPIVPPGQGSPPAGTFTVSVASKSPPAVTSAAHGVSETPAEVTSIAPGASEIPSVGTSTASRAPPPAAPNDQTTVPSGDITSDKASLTTRTNFGTPAPAPSTNQITTPSPPVPKSSQSSSNEKRVTTKLRRSSGTRTLAQAQIFENMNQISNIPFRKKNVDSPRPNRSHPKPSTLREGLISKGT
jgi:hypothetical protein